MRNFLGIDVGTSGTKALVCREDGLVLGVGVADHPIAHPRPGWSEQHPEDWWQSSVAAVRQALSQAQVEPKTLGGIGLSGQMHGSVFLDRHQRVLRPAILWNDQRTVNECTEIEELAGGRAALIQMVSNPAFTGFTAPKIVWLRHHEPELYQQLDSVLLPKDYLRFRLTGDYATDVSDASGTLLLDVKQRRWHTGLLQKLQLSQDVLPPCFESTEITGKLSAEAAQTLGLPKGLSVVAGGGDQAAGAVGSGIVQSGLVSAVLGTSGVVFAHAEQPRTHPEGRVHTMCHAVRGAWHMMGVVLAAGGSLQWFRNQFCQEEVRAAAAKQRDPYELILENAAALPPGAEGLFFLPYLTGERHPYADPSARGAWLGLSVRHTRWHLARAVIEGITFALRDCLCVMEQLGVSFKQIRLAGGGARSAFWRQLQADIFGHPVALVNSTEGAALGAAILAMVGTRTYDHVPEACQEMMRVVETIDPDPARHARYRELHAEYQKLYPLLQPVFPRLASGAEAGAS